MPPRKQGSKEAEEYRQRQEAIRRHQSGEKPTTIYRCLGKSKSWFYKWVNRYASPGEPPQVSQDPLADRSRVPVHQPARTAAEWEAAVLKTRRSLVAQATVETRYSPSGAKSIQWELLRLGYPEEELPAERTIYHILRRHDEPKARRARRQKGDKKPYPKLEITASNQLHQFDLVGPRYVRGDHGSQLFYSANVIDAYCRSLCLRQYPDKTSDTLCRFLVEEWFAALGIPERLQLDNLTPVAPAAFRPRSFGPFLRLCFWLRVEVWFIPLGEPWRNGLIERLNSDFETFYRGQSFENLAQLKQESETFERFRNSRYPHGALSVREHGSRVPGEVRTHNGFVPRQLPAGFSLEDFRGTRGKRKGRLLLPLRDGCVRCVRFVRSDLKVNLFGQHFTVPKPYCYTYVVATIDVGAETLQLHHEDQLIQTHHYAIDKDED